MPIPALVAALGVGALKAGGTTLGAYGLGNFAMRNEDLAKFFGQTEAQQGKQELGQFDRITGEINRDPFEKFSDWLQGRSYENILKETQNLSNTQLNTTASANTDLDKSLKLIDSLELSTSLAPKLDDRQTYDSYVKEIENAMDIARKARNLQVQGVDVKGLDEGGLARATAEFNKAEKQRLKDEAETLRQKIVGEQRQARQEALTAQRTLSQDNNAAARALQSDRLLAADKNALRAQELAILQAENQNAAREDNAAFRRMQQQYDNRRLDMEQQNINSRNRLQTIATLMQGLQGVANAGNRVMPARSYYTL